MPIYEVQGPDGRTFEVESAQPPTMAQLQPYFSQLGQQQPAAPPQGAAPPPAAPNLRDSIAQVEAAEQIRTQAGNDIVTGLGQSAANVVSNLGTMARKIPGVAALDRLVSPVTVNTTPQTPAQQVGKTAGDVGQFFLPAAGLAKLKSAVSTGVGVMDALIGAGMEAATAAGVQTTQQGTTDGVKTTAALAGGTNLGMKAAAKGLGVMAERIERAMVKPTQADVAQGFKAENVFKHNVGGSLTQSYDKVSKKIQDLSGKLKTVLKGSKGADVDLATVYADTMADYSGNKQADEAVSRILQKIEFELNAGGVKMGSGTLNLADANLAKQAVGELGAWLHNPGGRLVSDADNITEKVANTFYKHLKIAIENKAVGPVKDLNRQLSELIPIKTAIIRRIPVEQRQNVINLGDMIGFGTGTWGIALANRILRSGQTANAMNAGAEAAGPIANAAGRGAAGVSSQARPLR